MVPGTHGSTFGGNPLAMAVGNAVMDLVSSKKFLKNIKNLSKYFLLELKKIKILNFNQLKGLNFIY